ncbi:MAG: serine--tRNA ligase [Pirellulaceae bacterium]|nr:serine--tRNA ligase [Pirellulaceae bacterium]HJN09545.1 serine--tRNA ligase [Pirellulaceae bacterium]
MLDRKFILENVTAIKQNCVNRGVTADIDLLVDYETQRRAKLKQVEELNRRANEVSKSIGKAKDEAERDARKEEGRQLRGQKDAAQAEHDRLEASIGELQLVIPNMSHPNVPVGADDKANLEVRRGTAEVPSFDFTPLDHVDLGVKLDLIDLEGGARTSGHGFYFLRNEAVLLELALQQFIITKLMGKGFTPTITPDLAQDSILEGIGFNPRGPETQVYSIEGSNLSLVGTAEITLGGLYAGVTVDAEQLPIKLCGISHCFRTEAGAHGRETRGIYRVHQFTKVEMFAFTLPEQSDEIHQQLCDIECEIFNELGVPFRVVDTATGDLGGPAYRKYDLEAWMPGRGEGGSWGEITSTSNCTDYQSRRLKTKYKRKGEKGTQFVHTLNGTAVAAGRAMIAILENNQQADGSVLVPDVLQQWVGKERIEPKR